ncbi:MAG: lytic transglycosylase domain-containing protein [Bryobacteraceae bacterium]
MKRLAFCVLCVWRSFAGEYAVLHNGFRIAADRHETQGDLTRLYTRDGTLEVPSSRIAGFETVEHTPAAQASAQPEQQIVNQEPPSPEELIASAALRYGLLPEFVRSVAAVESAFEPDAISPKGALGLMQLMPATAAELGVDPNDPAQNADGGVRYLRMLLQKYKDEQDPVRMALAAYNAGPGAVDRYRRVPPYRETRAYVEKVIRRYLAALKEKAAGPS